MSESAPSQAQAEIDRWLQQGVAAVKAGNRQQARDLLMRVVEQDEKNVSGWLWLSAAVDSLEDQEACLSNVLAIDPQNQAAARGLTTVRQKLVDDYMQQGTAAAKQGQRAQARELLERVLTWDENHVPAWTLLGEVVETEEERETCLRKVQALDPGNETVRDALALIQRRQAAHKARAAEEQARDSAPRQDVVPPAMPEAPPFIEQDRQVLLAYSDDALDLSDEYLCPCCATPTQPDDRRCKSCGCGLWVRVPRSTETSTSLWGAIGIQFLNSFNYLALPLWTLLNLIISMRPLLGFQDLMDLIRLYLGLTHQVSPETANLVFEFLPRPSFVLLVLPVVLAVLTLIALFVRVRLTYYLFIATAMFDLLFVLACYLLYPLKEVVPMPFKVVATILVVLRVVLVFSIKDDFFSDNQRILLRLDRDVGDETLFLRRGLHYSKQKMWALAVLHLREAIRSLPDQIDGQVALMLSYIKLGHPDLAAQVLEVFEQARPGDPRIAELGAMIREEVGKGTVPA